MAHLNVPRIFDCDYQANTVHFSHSGSPFLAEDRVQLRVYRFTSRKTVSETFYLNIKINNATNDIVVTRGLRHVIVPEFNGISNTIDTSVLFFNHSRSPNISCMVSFNKLETNWPLVGRIIMGDQRTAVEAVQTTCQEFMYMELRYEHLQKPTPDVDYLVLNIELFDPQLSDELIKESYYLPIYIKNALLNSPPRSSYMSTYMNEVDQYILTTIIPGVISAEDYETPDNLLVYNITKPPDPDQGYFVHLDDPVMEITSFIQDDLDNHKIAYQPPNSTVSERRIYEVEFKVFDSHFAESMPIVLHIAVRPATTDGPHVSINSGLVLLEGQSREISNSNFQITDGRPEDVRLYVVGGLEHGRLLRDDRLALYFTIADINSDSLTYVHDDSESKTDRIDLKISDGKNNIMAKFPIKIIPKDDSPPVVIRNLGMEINEGQTQRFDTAMLLATDADSVDSSIVYVIVQPTDAGEIIRKARQADSGTRINRFSQRELVKGQIYYRHFGRENFHDEFRFTLRDQQDPPNESGTETFYIAINPVNENPPQLSPAATRLMRVSETDIALITKTELEYTDTETNSDKLTYIITTPPYFVYRGQSSTRNDAGRIIAMHNLTMVNKHASIPSVDTFKQEDINHLKIGYMPPMKDIGSEPRLVRFMYTVQDSSGNKVLGQQFDIDVQPVNDKPPVFVTSRLLVEEGGILGMSTDHISAADADTHEADLTFTVEQVPDHGRLQKGGVNLEAEATFNMLDLRRKDLRYIHDGSEVTSDTFTLSVSDVDNRVSKVFNIEVVPVDDVIPRVRDNLKPHLIVSEGSEAVILPTVLAATDGHTEEAALVFLLVKQPKYGILQLRGEPATRFTQADVQRGDVHYIHTSGEIGPAPVWDSITFILSDLSFKTGAEPIQYSLNITITPVDNQTPIIIAGLPINVEEGRKFYFSPDYITVKDADTDPTSVQFVITKQPQWGYLENIRTKPGSEKSKTGNPVTSFKLQDIIDNKIVYVQASHKGMEPTRDFFDFYATDGKSNSLTQTANIRITPINDEEPVVMLNDFRVEEGGSKVIDKEMLDAMDMDMPREEVRLYISQPPEYGDIVVLRRTPNGDVEATVTEFTAKELHNGMQLKYRHDDSENFMDKFAITASDGKHEVKRVCNITILPRNDERPELLKNLGIQMDYGELVTLSSSVLQAVDLDNSDDQVYYIVLTLPKKGVLQTCSIPNEPMISSNCRDIWVGQNFTQGDINHNLVRYLHTASIGTSDYDTFLFALSDGINKRQVETFQIRIMNSKRATITLTNVEMSLREGERVAITTDKLSAEDGSSRPGEIVFAIIRPPHLGQIEYLDSPLIPINSFTQQDLLSNNVVYNHLTKVDFTEDSFTFTVANGHGDNKDTEFRFAITPVDIALPSLAVKELVEVLEGEEIPITAANLRVDDPDTDSSNVTFHIVKQPTYGRLYNIGVHITGLFTQNAIDRGMITYESDGTHTGLDNFMFTLSDGKHDGFLINGTLQDKPVICSIYIKPLVNDVPKLVTLEQPDSLELFEDGRYGFRVNNHVLKAVDSDTMNTNLVYILEARPRHGHLENTQAKRYVRDRFTQRDLDEDTLQFIIDTADRETNDSFTFRIQDAWGNKLEDQRMEFHWSFVELERTSLVVCENIGTLPVTLVRTGDVSSPAYVSIEVQDRSTRRNEDYHTTSSGQVQFESGVSSVSWDVRVIEDGITEGTESFVVYIQTPVNAILGKRTKTRVRLINANNGECPQYLGMISKHQLAVPDELYLPGNAREPETETVLSPGSSSSRLGNQRHHHENALMDPAGTAVVDQYPEKAGNTVSDLTNDERRERRRKERKSKKERKKRRKKRKGGRKGGKKPRPTEAAPAQEEEMAPEPPVDINAPQECTLTTEGLLYFSPTSQQMYKCNGAAWIAWRQDSKDQQPETRECQQGWSKYESRCFKFINERLTWEVAEMLCQMSYGAHLATVRGDEHIEWLGELGGKKAYWIGLNDVDQTGTWRYTNGESPTYFNWKGGVPRVKRAVHKKNCVIVDKKRKMRNKPCGGRKARLICELDIGANDPSRAPPKRDVSSGGRSKNSKKKRNRSKERQSDARYSKKEKGFFFQR
ncbi:FREM1-like protein [Mya arenaria]|uniref:FREM1-like protein n=1 Tax=Mya arenaria TaxID=6604 RepID=A0ABY7FU37_MYAAR|nr:FREM1-like protein [Mya arenaria]